MVFFYILPYRSAGIGLGSAAARIGSILCPLLLLLGGRFPGLPYIIFGGGAILAGFFVLLLPETQNSRLPETVKDAEYIYGW